MNMLPLLSFGLLAATLSLSPCHAAVPAETVVKAKEQAKSSKADYVVLAVGGEWDKFSTRFKKSVWSQPESIAGLAPDTLVTEIVLPQNPSKEEAEAMQTQNKALNSHPQCLPSVMIFDQTGFCYAVFGGDTLAKSPPALSRQMQAAQKLREKRDQMIAKAETLNGVAKATLLGKAGEIEGLNRPDSLLKAIKDCDPEDESGYQKRFTFQPWPLHQYIKENAEEGLKVMDKMLSDPAYTTEQKQMILAVRGTVLRNNKGSKEDIRANFKKMKDLDPKSMLGKAAANAMEIYGK